MMTEDRCVRFRAMEPEDLEWLYTLENDTENWSVGNNTVPYSRYLLHNYIANATGDIYADHQVRMVVENGEHEAIGMVDLSDFDPTHLRAELGMVISKPFRRQGYGKAIVEMMKTYAREVLHLHQIYVIVGCNNESSVALFRKVGFRESSLLADWLYDGSNYHPALLMQYIL